MSEREDWNKKIIDEFRANQGKVGGMFEAMPLLLLHHTGAKSGKVRVNPLAYATEGDRLVVFGSKGGAPTNPDWYQNLKANPRATVEIGSETRDVRARVAEGEERERIWNRQVGIAPAFGEYQKKIKRKIPVVVLEPAR